MAENNAKIEVPKTGEALLYFSAPWCGPCRSFGPLLEKVCVAGGLNVIKINVDENPDFVYESQIRSVPTIQIVRDGTVLCTAIGAMSEGQLKDWLNEKAA